MSRSQFLRNAILLLAALLALLVILNVIFSQITLARWDLTQDGQFTLSPATVRILDGIEDRVRIKVFLSTNLPAPDNVLYQNLSDLLSEFEAESHGRLTFEIIEPESKADEEIAKGFGLRRVAVSQKDDTQRSMRLVFKGLTVIYHDTAETIPELRASDNLEYLIAKSIVNLTSPAQKSVGILTGAGGIAESPILRDSMREVFEEVFGKRIRLEAAKIDEHCVLSPHSDALVILGIQKKLTDCEIYALEQAAFSGTAMAIMQSPTYGDYRQPDQPRYLVESDLNPLLENAGIQLTKQLLLDRVHNLVGTQYTEDGVIEVSQPALPVITTLDKTHPVTQNLSAIVLPFSGVLSIDENKISSNGGHLSKLAMSSEVSISRPAGGDISVDTLQKYHPEEVSGPFAVAAVLQTPQNSRFVGNLPAGADKEKFIQNTADARYFIVPDGEFLFVNKIIGFTDAFAKFGIHMFVNATEWLVQDNALMEIRNRSLPQMFQVPDKDEQKRILWLNVFGIPALVLLCMVVLKIMRKRRQRRIKARFNQ